MNEVCKGDEPGNNTTLWSWDNKMPTKTKDIIINVSIESLDLLLIVIYMAK